MSMAVKKQSPMSLAMGILPWRAMRSFTAVAMSVGAMGASSSTRPFG